MNVLRGQNRLVLGGSLHWIFQSKAINGNPTIGTLEKIADALGVPVTELFEKSNTGDIVGFVKVGDTVHEVKSAEDVKNLVGKL